MKTNKSKLLKNTAKIRWSIYWYKNLVWKLGSCVEMHYIAAIKLWCSVKTTAHGGSTLPFVWIRAKVGPVACLAVFASWADTVLTLAILLALHHILFVKVEHWDCFAGCLSGSQFFGVTERIRFHAVFLSESIAVSCSCPLFLIVSGTLVDVLHGHGAVADLENIIGWASRVGV